MDFEIGNLFPGGDLGHVDLVLHFILVQAQWRREAVPNLMIMIVIKVTQIEWWNYLESVLAWIMAIAAAAAVPGETERIQPPWNSQDRECFRMAYWMLNSNQCNDISWTRITFWKLVVHHVKLNIPIHAQSWSGLIIDPEKKGFSGKSWNAIHLESYSFNSKNISTTVS